MRRIDRTIQHWHAEVQRAALTFESRWTILALKRHDPELAEKVHDQRNLFTEACIRGAPEDIEMHGESMLKGYLIASKALEAAQVHDDAYQIGECPNTGTRVVIGPCKGSLTRVRELHDSNDALEKAIHLTPDEVATLFGSIEALKRLAQVKRQWPGVEVTGVKEATP
jgi:hypothetical protein